jgi:adenylate cyclase class 2
MTHKNDIEIEYKFKVKDKQKVTKILDKVATKKTSRQYQSNIMFDNSSGIMHKTNGRVRVRTLGESGEKTLTYKRPLPPENGAKREIEYEIKFSDSTSQIEKILEVMEFIPTTSYERYQTKWQIGNVYISLDEYPYADFLEIEGQKEEIEKIAEQLGFLVSEGLTKPVDTLFQEWRKERGLLFKPHMRFNDFDK